jgi:hypothetical protein
LDNEAADMVEYMGGKRTRRKTLKRRTFKGRKTVKRRTFTKRRKGPKGKGRRTLKR